MKTYETEYGSARWAVKKAEVYLKTIRTYIAEGMDPDRAIRLVLDDSVIGAGYKAQIKYEILGARPA